MATEIHNIEQAPGSNPLVSALEAVLLFHDGGEWTLEKQLAWSNRTGWKDATTKTLCDTVRAALRTHLQPF